MKLLKFFEEKNFKNYVLGDEIFKDNIRCKRIYDVRSAAFFSFGEAKIKNDNVILIINGEYLSNIYTVLTEAWFQKTNLIVIAVYDSIYDIETHYLNRCLVTNMKFYDDDFEIFKKDVENSLEKFGPKLFNVVKQQEDLKNNYVDILKLLDKKVEKKLKVYLYDSIELNINFNKITIKNIESKYKYGILSKYCARVLNEKDEVLICNEECIQIDYNIFLSKYLTSNFKVIIKVQKNELNLVGLKNKGISIIELNDSNSDIEKFISTNSPCILLYKEG